MHGEDDQIVPIGDSSSLAIKLFKHGTLKTYAGLPHGMASTHPDIINADLLASSATEVVKCDRPAR
ncbi:pimeloyl-ACP methyl ester carboxylesterase [Bradyrhizobium sp. S3.5.5]